MTYELEPRYSSRKSFYGKAHVIEKGNETELLSYSTIVAKIIHENGKIKYKYLGHYSMTTTTHQKEFFMQNGLTENEVKKLFKNGELELDE